MEPPKHTPGPWTADWDDSGQWYVNIGGLFVSGNALRGDSGECVESANARLIAAAPELLKALKLYVEHFGDPLRAARAAIAKAEGESDSKERWLVSREGKAINAAASDHFGEKK